LAVFVQKKTALHYLTLRVQHARQINVKLRRKTALYYLVFLLSMLVKEAVDLGSLCSEERLLYTALQYLVLPA
jgi:hypothetical protein